MSKTTRKRSSRVKHVWDHKESVLFNLITRFYTSGDKRMVLMLVAEQEAKNKYAGTSTFTSAASNYFTFRLGAR
jgi:hypothetical protein